MEMPAIIRPICSTRGLAALHDADDPALVHHRDPVGERADLVQVFRDQQDGRAGLPLREQPLVDVLGGADVHAARGLGGDQHARDGAKARAP